MASPNRAIVAVLTTPVTLLIALFCLAPLAVLFAYSFFRVNFVSIDTHASLANYIKVASSDTYRTLIAKALGTGVLVAIITAVIGYPVAFFIAKRVVALKSALLTALLIPLYTGDLVRIFAWRVVLGAEGVLNSFLIWLGIIREPIWALLFSPTASLIVLTYNFLPFMVLGLWLGMESVDDRLIEAASDLGAGRARIFLRIVLPLSLPGLAAGGLMVFILVIGDYLTPQLIGGSSGVTVISVINDLFGTAFDWPLGSAIAWSLLAAMLVLIATVGLALSRTTLGRALLAGE
jgi:spermidine/putrescine transport system permease protein